MNSAEAMSVWTDGCCMPNPGVGGWAWVTRAGMRGPHAQGRDAFSTNQRMELMAVIHALEQNPGAPMRIHSDSQYVILGATKWSRSWLANGWKNSQRKDVANRELWERLLRSIAGRSIEFIWVKGHSGDEMNDLADDLATQATRLNPKVIERYRRMYHGAPA